MYLSYHIVAMNTPLPIIIHNPAQKERYKSVINELQKQGIKDFVLFPAIMNSNPVTGCALSHKAAVQLAIKHGCEYCIIFEDDIGFCPGGYEYFLNGLNECKDWQLFFGGVYHGTITPKGQYYAEVLDCCATHIYAIHNSYYDRVLACPDGENIDRYYARDCKRAFVSWPMVAIQKPFYSDIQRKPVDYENLRKSRGLKLICE